MLFPDSRILQGNTLEFTKGKGSVHGIAILQPAMHLIQPLLHALCALPKWLHLQIGSFSYCRGQRESGLRKWTFLVFSFFPYQRFELLSNPGLLNQLETSSFCVASSSIEALQQLQQDPMFEGT